MGMKFEVHRDSANKNKKIMIKDEYRRFVRLFSYRLDSSGNDIDDDKSSEFKMWTFVPEPNVLIYTLHIAR